PPVGWVLIVGAEASIVTARLADAGDTLPAASVALAVMVCAPVARLDEVIDQMPPEAVAVPSTVVPSVSKRVTVLPASAEPVKTGVATLVMLSVLEAPLSLAEERSGVVGAAGASV